MSLCTTIEDLFQSLKRAAASSGCCAGSVAWEAKKGKHFREAAFFGLFSRGFGAHFWEEMAMMSRGERCERLRSASASLRLSQG